MLANKCINVPFIRIKSSNAQYNRKLNFIGYEPKRIINVFFKRCQCIWLLGIFAMSVKIILFSFYLLFTFICLNLYL